VTQIVFNSQSQNLEEGEQAPSDPAASSSGSFGDLMYLVGFANDSIGVSNILDVLMKANTSVLKVFAFSFSNILAIMLAIGDIAFNIFFYFTLVYLLLDSETSFVDYIMSMFPETGNVKKEVKAKVKSSIHGIFASSL